MVLDLGFTTKAQRDLFSNRAKRLGINAEIHYLNAPMQTRKRRVENRNVEKDPAVYAFEVTDMMFNFIEPRFDIPDQEELENGLRVSVY